MRVLLLFRGAPGCGKSTFIKENNLERYTLSADELRKMYRNPVLDSDGEECISQRNEKIVWNTLFQMLENRMQHGDFTVIDATNSKTAEMSRYKKLAELYRYRIYCIDMTDVPIDVAKERNNGRIAEKRVPEDVIDKMYARFSSQNIPAGIKVIKPNELDTIWYKPIDLSKYNKIHVIGDTHGCHAVLQEYLDNSNGLKDDEYYIFTGDYIDRGLENAAVLKFLFNIINKPNVSCIEGNHERWLYAYGNDLSIKSDEFKRHTIPQLEEAKITKKEVRVFYRRLVQCVYFTYHDKTFIVTHGGLSNLPENLTLVPTSQMIRGVGQYEEMLKVNQNFIANTEDNVYQIHGHRNIEAVPVKSTERTYNLEGGVESGKYLRAVQITKDNIETFEIKNNVYRYTPKEVQNEEKPINDVSKLVEEMRNSKYIKEKKYGNISSFNFTHKAFNNKVWNEITCKARGFYIDTNKNEVAARSYDKFYNINERPETELLYLQNNLVFPVTAYVKENGFLGIISWNKEKNDLLIATKSSIEGAHVDYMRNVLYEVYSKETIEKMKEYLKNNNVSFIFECCDKINDPHIIDYDKNELFLLDIVENSIEFKKKDYNELKNISNSIGLKAKEKAYVISNWTQFFNWYNKIIKEGYMYNNRNIEGFVIEDSNNYMVKIKLHYYKFWKKLRGVFQTYMKYGHYRNTGCLLSTLDNEFLLYVKELYDGLEKEDRRKITEEYGNNICEIRRKFYEWKKEK